MKKSTRREHTATKCNDISIDLVDNSDLSSPPHYDICVRSGIE